MRAMQERITGRIMRDMSEGVFTLTTEGVIGYTNPAALAILDKREGELLGKVFAECFFEYEENDAFTQTVLDSVYDPEHIHENVVRYFTGEKWKTLHIVTSFLQDDGDRYVVVVLGDLTELFTVKGAFGRFLSEAVVEELLETPGGLALGGKKRRVTIMMSDLRGFTAMSERMDPTDLIAMLNHYLEQMTLIIQGHGGTIIEFIGDGIMAIFGAPMKREDHENAGNAVAAALQMQAAMTSINVWNEERDYPVLEMGVGIHTGDVIVGNIGSEKRTKYGAVGSDVNLCGRIESYTVGGQVLISPKTRALVRAELTVAEEMAVYPKGVDGELVLSRVTGIGAPYSIVTHEEVKEPMPLLRTIPVKFHIISGKHGEKKAHYGGITALSDDGMLFETETAVKVFDNLELEAGGNLLCKVRKLTEKGALLKFTSVPEGFGAFIKKEG